MKRLIFVVVVALSVLGVGIWNYEQNRSARIEQIVNDTHLYTNGSWIVASLSLNGECSLLHKDYGIRKHLFAAPGTELYDELLIAQREMYVVFEFDQQGYTRNVPTLGDFLRVKPSTTTNQ